MNQIISNQIIEAPHDFQEGRRGGGGRGALTSDIPHRVGPAFPEPVWVQIINHKFFIAFVLSKFGRSLSISVEQSKPRLLPTSSLLSGEFGADKRG